jgi:VWFA-related protein
MPLRLHRRLPRAFFATARVPFSRAFAPPYRAMSISPRKPSCLRFLSGPAAALLLAVPLSLAAQTAAPSQTIESQTTDTQQPISTLKLSAQRVIIDITITDAKGKPVNGLTQSDFHIAEDGAPQSIRTFEVHTAEPQAPLKLPKLPLNTFANLSTAPTGGPTTVVLYDLLNTPQDAQPFAHAQLLDFLKQRKASGQVAIFVLTDKLHMLQGFTEDDNELIAALNLQKARGYRSGFLQSGGEATQASDTLSQTEGNAAAATAAGQTDISFQTVSNMLKNMQVEEASYLLDQRVDLTAAALQEIARFLIGLPGRKNLLWLSGSFPTGIIPDAGVNGRDAQTGREQYEATRNYSSDIVAATDLLNASHVAVYPVDVRGLQASPLYSAANKQTVQLGEGSSRDFFQSQTAEHTTMDTIADNTGGRAFYNTNGLKEAAAEAIEEGSVYYTIAYSPTNRAFDGKLRKVKVELNQPGYHLAYRRTYFADNLDQVARNQQDAPSDALAVTLEHGAPVARELFFEAHVVSEGAPVPATHEQMDELIRYEAMATKSKRKTDQELKTPILLQRYVIQYGLIPRQLDLRLGADQARRDNLEFAAVSYNEDGLTLNGTRTQIQDVIRPDRWSMMQESGYHVPMAILVPVQARSLRLAVRDASNGHMGSLELSLPLPPEPATTAPPEAPPPAPASVPPAS